MRPNFMEISRRPATLAVARRETPDHVAAAVAEANRPERNNA